MSLKIGIQPDHVTHPNGRCQSFSRRWIELARKQGIDTVPVDVFSDDAIKQIGQCDAFMWRYPSSAHPRAYAKRLMYAVEAGLRMPVFPSLKSTWYYENKIAQHCFFQAAGIPHAKTDVLWTRQAATRFCEHAVYPFVFKLEGGHQSANVRLVRNRDEAMFHVDEMFSHGLVSLAYRPASRPRLLLRRLRAAAETARDRFPYASTAETELQYGYFYAQEFLPKNTFETSVVIIGNRAFAARRFTCPGDFRTRGSSGRMDWNPEKIGEDDIRLAFRVACKLGSETVAVDILHRGAEPVIVELTVNYASWVVRQCPGHWVRLGDPTTGPLEWVNRSMRAADAIFMDFLARIRPPACTVDTDEAESFSRESPT